MIEHGFGRRMRTLVLAVVAMVATGALVATGAEAKVVQLTGTTTVTPSAEVTQFLSAKGVSVSANAPATASGGALSFPVTNGFGNTKNFTGILVHQGGLTFSKGNRSVALNTPVAVRSRQGAVLLARLPGVRGGCGQVKQSLNRFLENHPVFRKVAGKRVKRFVRTHPKAARKAVKALRNYCSGGRVIVLARLRNLGKSVSGKTATLTADLKLSGQAAQLINRRFGTTLNAGAPLGSAVSVVTPAS